jgi:hypothetical protein
MNSLKWNYVTYSKFLGTSKPDTPFIPSFSKDDEKFKMAKFA